MFSLSRSSIIQFLVQNKFRKEITLIICVKLIALFLLWGFFFSHPVSRKLNKAVLVEHFVSGDTSQ